MFSHFFGGGGGGEGDGTIIVQTEHPYYYPGQHVTGKIYINMKHKAHAGEVELILKGKEKAKFIEHEQRENEVVHHKRHNNRCFLKFKHAKLNIDGGELHEGHHQIDFEFDLPDRIPASFYFHEKHHEDRPYAKIKYTLQCKIPDAHMENKQTFIVREHPLPFKEGESDTCTKPISTCCCLAKGESTLTTKFGKNIYYPNERIEGHIAVNNEHCQIDCSNVHFAVESKLNFHIPGFMGWGTSCKTVERDLIKENHKGPEHGCCDWSKNVDLDLSHVKMPDLVDKKDKKSGGRKALSAQDAFMVKGIQSACHGKFFTCEYFLVAETTYDGCTCCAELPHAKMPISIEPLSNPDCHGFQPPHDWEPRHHGMLKPDCDYDC